MKRLNQTESPIFVIFCSLFPKAILFDFYSAVRMKKPCILSYPQSTQKLFEPAHDKAYNKTCVTSKDSDQYVYPPSAARVSLIPLDSAETVEGTCDQRKR